MQFQALSPMAFVGTIFSIILSIGFPIALIVIGKKKFGAKISTFFIGAATFVLFALVFEQMLHWLIMVKLGLNQNTNEWLYYIYAALAAAVFEETGRIVAMKFFMKNRFDLENAFMYGIGHGGIEAVIIGGISSISVLINMIMINSGAMEATIATLPAQTQAATVAQLSALCQTPTPYFYMVGIERFSAVILHIGLSLLIYKGLKSGKKSILALAYGIHFAVDFIAVVLAFRTPIWIIEIIAFAMAVGTIVLSNKLNKESEEEA